ncbi:hypothetical protein [Antrihabitans cavernicola]|uniref:Uncharacterized protein n=1 Tax=Antrihabitans cavernicola TaxID=2495913 RepID=A0A5A7S7K5_9NOCA|nr:hypothetical protein [Spelaeibacter cavernicola]KAA0018528.1 hypothetical protein FOY51_23920 [Spelaeibacter cavernicola]
MAGDYENVKPWSAGYDKQASNIAKSFASLANGLWKYGDVLNAAGYNWALANYRADPNPNKGPAPVQPPRDTGVVFLDAPVPPSAGGNGDGLDSNIPGLLQHIGLPVPNGDRDKLNVAANAWDVFAKADSVTGAADKIKTIADTFAGIDAPEVQMLTGHLGTLQQGAAMIAKASAQLATPVGEHHTELNTMRGSIEHGEDTLYKELAVTAVIGVVAVALTGGAAALVGGARAGALIADLGLWIRGVVTGSRLLAVLGAATATFAAIEYSDEIERGLSAIAAMTVESVAGKDPRPGANNPAEDPNFGRLRPAEQATLRRAQEAHPELELRAVENERDGEYEDKDGNTYDQMGNPATSEHWSPRVEQSFEDSVQWHLLKSNDGTMIDLTGFSEESKTAIKEYLDSLPSEQQEKILRIGF